MKLQGTVRNVVTGDIVNITRYTGNTAKNKGTYTVLKKKNKFVIATGRSIYQLRKVIDNYEIFADYYICNDGGVIFDKDFNALSGTSNITFIK